MKFSLLIWLFVSLFAASDSVTDVYKTLQGSFVISDRPDDFKSIVVWTQSEIEIEGVPGLLLFHERATVRTMNKPYNQQVWVFSKKDDKILLQHYDLKSIKGKSDRENITKDDLEPLSDMDILLKKSGESWAGSVDFTNPEYLTRFVHHGYKASVSLVIFPNEITYHLQIFDKTGKQIYGPTEKGYTLTRKKDL